MFVDPSIACGNCQYCHAGTEQYCAQYAVMGMTHFTPAGKALFDRYGNGGFAEYMKVPGNNIRALPDQVSFEWASKLAFLGVALKAVEKTRLRAGETIVISGASGALGTCAVMAASALGAGQIIAVARDTARLERVRQVSPGTVVPVSTQADPQLSIIRQLTAGRGADVYVDCLPAGGIGVTQQCLMSLRAGRPGRADRRCGWQPGTAVRVFHEPRDRGERFGRFRAWQLRPHRAVAVLQRHRFFRLRHAPLSARTG